MAEEKTFSPEEIAARLEELRARKCPCGEPVRSYVFASVLVPYEINADNAVREAEDVGADRSIWFAGLMDNLSFSCILLSSLCPKCGRAELWRCDVLDLEALCSVPKPDDWPIIVALHHENTLRSILDAAGSGSLIGAGVRRLLDSIRENRDNGGA